MRNGFLIRTMLLRDIAGRGPVPQRRTEITGLLEVIRKQLRLRRADETAIELLQNIRNALVADLTATPEQARIGRIAGQRMPERIHLGAAVANQQPGINELSQRGVERGCGHAEDKCQQSRREFAADGGADLCHLLDGRHAIETGDERVVQARRNGQRRQRPIEKPGIGTLGHQSGFQHALGKLLDKQRHAVGLGDDLAHHLFGQRLAAREITDQAGAGARAQAVHGKAGDVSERAPVRDEFRPVRYHQQHAEVAEPIREQGKQFLCRRVDPLRVLDEDAQRLVGCGSEQDVPQQGERFGLDAARCRIGRRGLRQS